MLARLKKLREQITIGVVGGSDLVKQKEQLGEDGASAFTVGVLYVKDGWMLGADERPSRVRAVVNEFDYSFSENGLVAFHKGVKVGETNLKTQYSNEQINRLVNFCLRYIADLDIPVKRCVRQLEIAYCEEIWR